MYNIRNLKRDLMNQIRGNIHVIITGAEVTVDVEAPDGSVWKMVHSSTGALSAQEVVQRYRNDILKDYFYHVK